MIFVRTSTCTLHVVQTGLSSTSTLSTIHMCPPQAACGDDDALRDLGAAATAVTEALNSLIQEIKEGVRMGDGGHYDEAVDAILSATERLFRYVRMYSLLPGVSCEADAVVLV